MSEVLPDFSGNHFLDKNVNQFEGTDNKFKYLYVWGPLKHGATCAVGSAGASSMLPTYEYFGVWKIYVLCLPLAVIGNCPQYYGYSVGMNAAVRTHVFRHTRISHSRSGRSNKRSLQFLRLVRQQKRSFGLADPSFF